jgi:hypothetical protein
MTNKMPVVGQRYLSTRTGWECELKRFNEETATAYDKYGTRLECVATRFWDYFEELPEDNLQETEEVKVNKKANPVDFEKGEVNEVERALEELKKSLVKPISANLNEDVAKSWRDQYFLVCKAGWNLVNALETERNMSKPEPKIDIKEERVDPVSLEKKPIDALMIMF